MRLPWAMAIGAAMLAVPVSAAVAECSCTARKAAMAGMHATIAELRSIDEGGRPDAAVNEPAVPPIESPADSLPPDGDTPTSVSAMGATALSPAAAGD